MIHVIEDKHTATCNGDVALLRTCSESRIDARIASSFFVRHPSHLGETIGLGGSLKGELERSISLAARYSLKYLPTAHAASAVCGLSNEIPRSQRLSACTHSLAPHLASRVLKNKIRLIRSSMKECFLILHPNHLQCRKQLQCFRERCPVVVRSERYSGYFHIFSLEPHECTSVSVTLALRSVTQFLWYLSGTWNLS